MNAPDAPPPPTGLITRYLRGAAFTSASFIVAQALRLGANLILARLLFPEAFGMMALVTMVLTGLNLLSDTGVQQSIQQHARGDDRDFLNTAWTLNLVRGVALWLLACALAWPIATLYGVVELQWLIPVGGLGLVLAGLTPTRVYTAERHVLLGRIVLIELAAQIMGIIVMVAVAWITGSVWSLVIGGLIGASVKLGCEWALLQGLRNRLRWEPAAGRALLAFGGWLLLSSACGFLLTQGDRAVLGLYLTTEALGIYNIGWFLAAFPMMLAYALAGRLLIPVYREVTKTPQTGVRIKQLRLCLSGGVWGLLLTMALIGPWLVEFLYDARYALAGPIVTLIACMQMVLLVTLTYDQAALAQGQSKRFFLLIALRSAVQTACLVGGVILAGLPGAIAGQAVAAVLVYPAFVRLARDLKVWDGRHDLIYATLALLGGVAALALHADRIATLAQNI